MCISNFVSLDKWVRDHPIPSCVSLGKLERLEHDCVLGKWAFVPKICSWQVVGIPLCVSTYVFGAQHATYKKEEKDTLRAGSKLNNYFLRSGPLHDYFLRVQDYTTSTL